MYTPHPPKKNELLDQKIDQTRFAHHFITVFFFFPVNIKSAREPRFLEDIHGHFFGFTGTFFRKFTGKWLRSRALFWTFSRALFRVSRAKKLKCSRTLLEVHGHILKFKVLCSRAPANVHGHFCQKN